MTTDNFGNEVFTPVEYTFSDTYLDALAAALLPRLAAVALARREEPDGAAFLDALGPELLTRTSDGGTLLGVQVSPKVAAFARDRIEWERIGLGDWKEQFLQFVDAQDIPAELLEKLTKKIVRG